jgi:vacuolar-type H+-ATPase subunit I/STV1
VAISIPLLLYWFFDDVGSIISSSESYLKSDVIGGQSNMEFRLTILKYAYTMIDKTSFLYGSALSGNQTVPLAMLPGWGWWGAVKGISDASIHSDFVVVLVLMGILGYTVFSIAFYLVLKDRFRELGRRDLLGDGVVLQAISIIGVVALIVYCSDQPYLSYYNHAHSVWMLLLISEVARKSKIIGKAQGVGQMIVPAVPRLAGLRR